MRKLDYKITCSRCDGAGYVQFRHDRRPGDMVPRFDPGIEVQVTNLSNNGTTYVWQIACSACMTGWPMKVPHCDLDHGMRTDSGITHVE